MKRFRFSMRGLATGIAAVAVLVSAVGIAYASIPWAGNVYNACMLKGIGTIRLIDKSLPSTNLMSHCADKETEISWNQAGQPGPAGPAGQQGLKGDPGPPGTNGANGTNGTSVTTSSEPADANCADGGVQLTAANGVSYVCNGKDGTDGTSGVDGKDGVSVTSAVEPPGANCANGGSKFAAANGVTYAVMAPAKVVRGCRDTRSSRPPLSELALATINSATALVTPVRMQSRLALRGRWRPAVSAWRPAVSALLV
jgi:hypothetical protein